MEFYEAVNKRKTTREFLKQEAPYVIIHLFKSKEVQLEQYTPDIDKQIRFERWK